MTGSRSKLQIFIAFALFPLATRLLLIVTGVENPLDSLSTGILADLYWSFLLTVVVIVLLRCQLWAVLPLLFLWAVTYGVDFEHITALGQLGHHSNMQYLLDWQFIVNSMGALSPLKLLSTGALMALALWLLISGAQSLRRRQRSVVSSPLWAAVVLCLVVAGAAALYWITPTIQRNTLSWHDRNFFAHHLDTLAAAGVATLTPPLTLLELAPGDSVQPLFLADLAAPRPAIGTARNVLLIVVEGLSGAYIESVANAMGRSAPPLRSTGAGPMPLLSALAQQSLLIPNFISHRTQTIRGLYSLLCSDFPKLDNSVPKPLELLGNDRAADRCLPRLLRERGYSTHYFQAADLQFMSKNTVMPFIGFDDVRGKAAFALPQDYYFDWGPDDSDFFSQSAHWLETMAQRKQPWFTTLLTVGTHHPYALRDGAAGDNAKLAAVAAADRAVAALITRLQKSGITDNTLILITSDESHGVSNQHFGNNWGMMMALAPDLAPATSDDVFSTADVTLSVMDYLNFQAPQHNLLGRSLFRDYTRERTVLFSQWTSVSMSTQKGQVISCPILVLSFLQWLLGDGHCEQLHSDNGEMFSQHYRHSVLTEPQLQLYQLQAMMDARLREQGGNAKQYINLANNDRVALPVGRTQSLSAGQYLNLESGTLVTVELDVSYSGTAQSILELSLQTLDLKGVKTGKSVLPTLKLPSITDGERMTLSFSFPVFSDYSHVQLNLQALSLLADGEVVVHRYRIATQNKERFSRFSLALLDGQVIAANGTVATLYNPPQELGAPLAFITQGSVYTPGSTERLNSEKSFLTFGGPGWWGVESWGRWSKQRAGIRFFLGNDNAVNEHAFLLSVRAQMHIRKGHQQVEVWGNGELLDTWELGRRPERFTAKVPAKLFNRGMLAVNFVVRGPLQSPQQRNSESKDQRKLGMGLIDFTLSKAAP